MSLDINELVRLVKQAAVEAVRAGAPMAVCYGTVLSPSPLKIQVDQKKILGEAQLILCGTTTWKCPRFLVQGKALGHTTQRRRAAEAAMLSSPPTGTNTRAGKSGGYTTP